MNATITQTNILTHLVQCIIQTLIQVLQVQQDHCLTRLHAHLDPIDVSTHLKTDNICFVLLQILHHQYHLLLHYYVFCASYQFKCMLNAFTASQPDVIVLLLFTDINDHIQILRFCLGTYA